MTNVAIGANTRLLQLPADTSAPTDDGATADEPTEILGDDGFQSMVVRSGAHTFMVGGDMLDMAGVDIEEKTIRPLNVATLTGLNAGIAGLNTMRRMQGNALTRRQAVGTFADEIKGNTAKVTPTLVAAVAGPAIADGLTYFAPQLVPKFSNKPVPAGQQPAPGLSTNKNDVMFRRGAAAAVGVTALAALAFLVKPNLFPRAGFISEASTMAKSPVFSNRMLAGLVGGAAAAGLLAKATNPATDNGTPYMIGAGAAAVATAGAIAAMPFITRGSTQAMSRAFMPNATLFMKPNLGWFKDFGTKVVPLTSIPAATSASTYFDIFSDFDKITDTRSPYRR